MKRKLIAAIGVAGMMVSMAACGSDDGGSDSSGKKSGPDGFKGQTLTVWAMDGSTPEQWTEGRHRRIREEDRRQGQVRGPAVERHPAEADAPPSPRRTRRTSSRSATPRPPPTPRPAASRTSATSRRRSARDWTAVLNKAAVVDGKQYAAPWYSANRVVIYNKKIWAEAGIKETPKTRDEFFEALDTIKTKTDAEPIYLPGQNWYFFDGLTIGKGADLVKKDGGKWVSNLGRPQGRQGHGHLQASTSPTPRPPRTRTRPPRSRPRSSPRARPAPSSAWAGRPAPPIKANPAIEKDIGYFTIPGETADKPEGVFLGGSNLAVAAGQREAGPRQGVPEDRAVRQVRGPARQGGRRHPEQGVPRLQPGGQRRPPRPPPRPPKVGGTTPLIPEWAAVENAPNPIKTYHDGGPERQVARRGRQAGRGARSTSGSRRSSKAANCRGTGSGTAAPAPRAVHAVSHGAEKEMASMTVQTERPPSGPGGRRRRRPARPRATRADPAAGSPRRGAPYLLLLPPGGRDRWCSSAGRWSRTRCSRSRTST